MTNQGGSKAGKVVRLPLMPLGVEHIKEMAEKLKS